LSQPLPCFSFVLDNTFTLDISHPALKLDMEIIGGLGSVELVLLFSVYMDTLLSQIKIY